MMNEKYLEADLARMDIFIETYIRRTYGGTRLYYNNEYILDIQELQELAEEDRRHLFSQEELKVLCNGMNQEQMKKIFDTDMENVRYNHWLDDCQWILEEIDRNYEETLEIMNKELESIVVNGPDRGYPDYKPPKFKVINEKRFQVSFEDLNLSEYEEKIIKLNGFLTYVQNPPVERIKKADWICRKCGGVETSDWKPPKFCDACQSSSEWRMQEDTIEKEKIQEGLLTQEYEASQSGFQISLSIIIAGEDTGKYAPGDHISIMGRVTGKMIKQKGKEPIYTYIIEISQIRKEERKITINKEDIEKIELFAKTERNVLESLSELYAPGIIGLKVQKKAIVLQAAGCDEEFKGGRRVRGNIHILLVGDPGTGKSQLLMATKQISPKSFYVTDASAAGLTAAVDEVAGKRVMVAGIMVLADGGIAAIDEIEKMNKDDRKAIHPAMEQGEIHKSKAGLHASFKSRASVLAAANPIDGRFEKGEPIPDQINLEPSLMNRFDLIYIFKEENGTAGYERERARRILNGEETKEEEDFLMKYIMHSKSVHPVIPKNIINKIAEYFASLKVDPDHHERFLNARTLESLQRLTLASARARLHENADEEDLENAIELMDVYLKQFNFDTDAISGITGTVRECIKTVRNLISDNGLLESEILKTAETLGYSSGTIETALENLSKNGEVYYATDGRYRRVSR